MNSGQALQTLHAPDELTLDLETAVEGTATAVEGSATPATLVFVSTFAEAEERAGPAVEAALADDLSWVAYPKAGQLGTDLNRDALAAFMTARGVRPVRQVALDDTWSALRFRPALP